MMKTTSPIYCYIGETLVHVLGGVETSATETLTEFIHPAKNWRIAIWTSDGEFFQL